jgi:hypothetical protein
MGSHASMPAAKWIPYNFKEHVALPWEQDQAIQIYINFERKTKAEYPPVLLTEVDEKLNTIAQALPLRVSQDWNVFAETFHYSSQVQAHFPVFSPMGIHAR